MCEDEPLFYLTNNDGERRKFAISVPWEGRSIEVDLLACSACGFCAIIMPPKFLTVDKPTQSETVWDKIGDASGET